MTSTISTFGKSTPVGHPDTKGRAALFVPAAGHEIEMPSNLKNGAGIVGFGNQDGTLTIYFESNRFADPNLQKWEQKVQLAYGRMVDHLPTTSRIVMLADQLEQVGLMDSHSIELTIFDGLKRWLNYSKVAESAPESALVIWKK